MGGPATVDGIVIACTDNFYKAEFTIDDSVYVSTENFFQASKTISRQQHQKIRKEGGPGIKAFNMGNDVTLRKDWEKIKVRIMMKANLEKFRQNNYMRQQLIKTKGNITLGYGFWPKWNGLILQRVRAQLRQNGEQDTKTIQRIQKLMKQYQGQQQ